MFYLRLFSLDLVVFNLQDNGRREDRRYAEWNNKRRWNRLWLIGIPCKRWLSTNPSSAVCFLSKCPHLSWEITQTTCSGEATVRWGLCLSIFHIALRTWSRGFPACHKPSIIFVFSFGSLDVIVDSSELTKQWTGSQQGTRHCRLTHILPVRSQFA